MCGADFKTKEFFYYNQAEKRRYLAVKMAVFQTNQKELDEKLFVLGVTKKNEAYEPTNSSPNHNRLTKVQSYHHQGESFVFSQDIDKKDRGTCEESEEGSNSSPYNTKAESSSFVIQSTSSRKLLKFNGDTGGTDTDSFLLKEAPLIYSVNTKKFRTPELLGHQVEQSKQNRNTNNYNSVLSNTTQVQKIEQVDIQKSSPRGLNLKMMKEKLNLTLDATSSSSLNNSCETVNRTYGSTNSFSFSEIASMSITNIDGIHEISPENNVFEKYYTEFRDEIINKELTLLSQNHQNGVFVIPSVTSLQVWFGVIFVYDGPYRDGIFHFTIYFKDNYPETIPVIRFRSRVFHPQIGQRKGTLNIRFDNSNITLNDSTTTPKKKHSNKRLVHVWQILKYLRSCFYHVDLTNAVNPTAAALFQSNYELYLKKCRESVQKSLYAYEEQNYEDDNIIENPLKGCLVQGHIVKGFKHYLSLHSNNGGAVENVIGWAKHHLGKLLNNLNTFESSEEKT